MDAKIKMGNMPMKSKEGEKLKQLTILIVTSFGMKVGFLIPIPFEGLNGGIIGGICYLFPFGGNQCYKMVSFVL